MKFTGIVLMVITLIGLIGCSPAFQQTSSLESEIQKTMEHARHNLDVIEQLQVQDTYAYDFQEAQSALIMAEQYAQENRHDQAYIAALNSLAATQRIFRQMYQERTSQEAKQEIRSILLDDPDNPLKDFLPLLNEILDYAEKIDSGHKQIDFTQALADLEKIARIGEEARNMSKLLVTEVTFAPGEYDVSDTEKQRLNRFAEALISEKQMFEKVYPDLTFMVKTKIVGYADQLDFREESNLVALLPDKVTAQIPQHPTERRQFLNLWLSEFRGKTLKHSFQQQLLQTDPAISESQIHQESMGLGESIPPEVHPPYPVQDPRRRICKIYGYIAVP